MATEIKIICPCGQKFKFDVEPVNGRIPFEVLCPVCGADASAVAHSMLQEQPAMEPITPAVPRLSISQHAAPALATAPPMPLARPAANPYRPAAPVSTRQGNGSGWPEFNMLLGIAGALAGAGVAFVCLFAFAALTGIRFPLTGILVGFLTGLSAKLFYRGTDNVLGVAAAVVSLLAFVASQFLIFGGFSIFNIISLVVSVSFAYRQASE
jgi:hypothetical protein